MADNMNGGDEVRRVLISGGARGIGRSLARNCEQPDPAWKPYLTYIIGGYMYTLVN